MVFSCDSCNWVRFELFEGTSVELRSTGRWGKMGCQQLPLFVWFCETITKQRKERPHFAPPNLCGRLCLVVKCVCVCCGEMCLCLRKSEVSWKKDVDLTSLCVVVRDVCEEMCKNVGFGL